MEEIENFEGFVDWNEIDSNQRIPCAEFFRDKKYCILTMGDDPEIVRIYSLKLRFSLRIIHGINIIRTTQISFIN